MGPRVPPPALLSLPWATGTSPGLSLGSGANVPAATLLGCWAPGGSMGCAGAGCTGGVEGPWRLHGLCWGWLHWWGGGPQVALWAGAGCTGWVEGPWRLRGPGWGQLHCWPLPWCWHLVSVLVCVGRSAGTVGRFLWFSGLRAEPLSSRAWDSPSVLQAAVPEGPRSSGRPMRGTLHWEPFSESHGPGQLSVLEPTPALAISAEL